METVIPFMKEMFATLSILLCMLFPFGNTDKKGFTPINADEVKLSFSVVADVHVETNYSKSYHNFDTVLRDIKLSERNDALVFLGDNVMNGQVTEDFFFYGALKALKPSKNIFVATGNHDLGNGEGDFNSLMDKFISLNNCVLHAKIDKPYYYKIVNGHYFIFLSTEHSIIDTEHISEEQFTWLNSVLKEAEQSGKPIFVFNHYPITLIDDEDNYRLAEMLNDYENVLYMHGHYHRYAIYNERGVNCINLPRVTETVEYEPGTGAVVEVYENEIIVRIRDFYKGEWADRELHYPIVAKSNQNI